MTPDDVDDDIRVRGWLTGNQLEPKGGRSIRGREHGQAGNYKCWNNNYNLPFNFSVLSEGGGQRRDRSESPRGRFAPTHEVIELRVQIRKQGQKIKEIETV